MTIAKTPAPAACLYGFLFTPAARAHPGHEHEPGILAGTLHSLPDWSPLLLLATILLLAVYFLSAPGRR